jgi:3-phenylpropionate/cinnamic acid dioxygenase small subunit
MPYTPEQLSDLQDITDVLHAYCRAVDDNRPDDIIELFADDCHYDYGGPSIFVTKEEAYRFFRAGTDETFRRTAHFLSNVDITLDRSDPDRASSVSYINAWHEFNADGSHAWIFGRYVDEHVRTATAGWRICQRRVEMLGHEDWPHPVIYFERNILQPRSR